MKVILSFLVSIVLLECKEVLCLVPEKMKETFSPLFINIIDYTQLQVKLIYIKEENTVRYFSKFEDSKFAIVRKDILWQMTKYNLNNNYIILGELPYFAQLNILQEKNQLDIDSDFFLKKIISVGSLEDKNNIYIKELVKEYNYKNNIFYKSYAYEESMEKLKKGNIDLYFTFLPKGLNINSVHQQTLFSQKFVSYFNNLNIFKVTYNGIFSPYVIIASDNANDEEIENVIYRLMEKKIFIPVTDKRFGKINQYVRTHLESVKKVLVKNMYKNKKVNSSHLFNKECKKYHYEFLRLLRMKPQLKKILSKSFSKERKKDYIKKVNKILLNIDINSEKCDLQYMKNQKEFFLRIKQKIYTLKF